MLWALPDRAVGQVEQAGLRAVGVTSMPPVHPPEVLQQFPELRELPPPERPEHMFAKLTADAGRADARRPGLAP